MELFAIKKFNLSESFDSVITLDKTKPILKLKANTACLSKWASLKWGHLRFYELPNWAPVRPHRGSFFLFFFLSSSLPSYLLPPPPIKTTLHFISLGMFLREGRVSIQ